MVHEPTGPGGPEAEYCDTCRPALTPAEWAGYPNWPPRSLTPEAIVRLPLYFPSKHGIAAANLHGQPFGFTAADVAAVRACVEFADGGSYVRDHELQLRSLATRLAALLPPAPAADPGQW